MSRLRATIRATVAASVLAVTSGGAAPAATAAEGVTNPTVRRLSEAAATERDAFAAMERYAELADALPEGPARGAARRRAALLGWLLGQEAKAMRLARGAEGPELSLLGPVLLDEEPPAAAFLAPAGAGVDRATAAVLDAWWRRRVDCRRPDVDPLFCGGAP